MRNISFIGNKIYPEETLNNDLKLKPGATMTLVVWRKKEYNDGFYSAELIARQILGDPPKNDQVTCGPGPFSMGGADLVSDQLIAAGFTNIEFLRSDADMLFGRSINDAIDFSIMLGPAGEVVRLAGQQAIDKKAELAAAMRKNIELHVRSDGTVWLASSCWLVSAQSPL